ncbi:MAG: hypothetical protein Q8928_04590 [Bacteroidota bacterium]|nr:hypothetical protein [Bacteroidota bacterium]
MKCLVTSIAIFFLCIASGYAGPPFYADDPEPVDYKHWEYYISSVNNHQQKVWSGTLPHFEVNYGILPNVQLHLLLPVNYSFSRFGGFKSGYANTEVGLKYRFIKESEACPQVGVFPIIEVPTIANSVFGNGNVQLYLPVWLQKSYGKLTTYGGGGYWINPGIGNQNWLFTGWEVQYDFSSVLTLGGEIYYHTASDVNGQSSAGFNAGGFLNFSPRFHLLFSVGNSFIHDNLFSSYIGLLWTI